MDIDLHLLNDDLSSVMGTETLLGHDMVPECLPASSKGPAEQQEHHIRGVRYLVGEGHSKDTLENRFEAINSNRQFYLTRWELITLRVII